MQAVLEQCGFNPGPVDGLWARKTACTAQDCVRTHGGSPASDDQPSLIARVDGFRIGDQGPCPVDHAATGPEITREADELIAQIKTELDGKIGDRDWDAYQSNSIIDILGTTITQTRTRSQRTGIADRGIRAINQMPLAPAHAC